MDYLVHITFIWPPGMTVEEQQRIIAAERARARQLAATGNLERLWRIPGQRANWGIWHAADATELHAVFIGVAADVPDLTATVHPLAAHPNDPARWTDGSDQ